MNARPIVATRPGKCDCCATPYETGARLHLEGRWWVLDEHPEIEKRRGK